MKITCGTDIIEIDRIEQDIKQIGEKFINKIFTPNEVKYCESKGKQKYQHYAARFAAKEATFKAISWKLENKYDLQWKDIEVINDKEGKPQLKIKNVDMIDIQNIDISLSHCRQYAIAYVSILSES